MDMAEITPPAAIFPDNLGLSPASISDAFESFGGFGEIEVPNKGFDFFDIGPYQDAQSGNHSLPPTNQYPSVNLTPSWTRTYLENRETFGFDDHEAAHAVGTMALAGVQTIGSPLNTFVYAMVNYPQWLEAIQKEIDEACGDNMPTTADSPKLPTLRAVIKEGLPWRPAVPTGWSNRITSKGIAADNPTRHSA